MLHITRLLTLIFWCQNQHFSTNYLTSTCDMFWRWGWNEKKKTLNKAAQIFVQVAASQRLWCEEKEKSTRTKTSLVCNNSSVAWVKTHLCCATELCVLIGLLSDAELVSLCQSEPAEPNSSCCRAVVATFGPPASQQVTSDLISYSPSCFLLYGCCAFGLAARS